YSHPLIYPRSTTAIVQCLYLHQIHYSPRYLVDDFQIVSCPVDFADLAVIKLAKTELYLQTRDVFCSNGFVYAINYGYTQAQVIVLYFFSSFLQLSVGSVLLK
ncbi:hypothetical protein SERLADRAFT_393347, partial [Serpula lacrymans var. lacrymans S7.9]